MSRISRIGKHEEWKERPARYDQSNQTIAQFCLDEGISTPSFYQWRKKLRPLATDRTVRPGRFQPVHIVSSLTTSGGQPTIVRLGHGMQIELGSDLAIVKGVVHQLLESAGMTHSDGSESC